jgi:hypothetical protein
MRCRAIVRITLEQDKNTMKSKPELVGQFFSLTDFDKAKALLTCAGFHTSSDNETTLQTRPYLTMALGGARLFVPPNEAKRARALLAKHQPKVIELNYAHRVRRSMLSVALSLFAAVLIGSIVGIRRQNLETGFSVGMIASVIWLIILSHILVPKANLKQK